MVSGFHRELAVLREYLTQERDFQSVLEEALLQAFDQDHVSRTAQRLLLLHLEDGELSIT